MAGTKRVELRRAVPANPVGTIVIYSSLPTQAVIAVVDVLEIVEASPSKLWEIARDNGGGLTRKELRDYFNSKKTGFAMMLGDVRVFADPVNPKKFFRTFTPPQSFKYLTQQEHRKILTLLERRDEK